MAPGALFFGLLGPVLIRVHGSEVRLGASRQRVLLAALLTRAGRPASGGELAELVWDGVPPAGAADTLRTYVMRLRRTLGPEAGARIVTGDLGYLIEVSDDERDTALFAALCRAGRMALDAGDWALAAARLREALGLWRAEPFADVPSEELRRAEGQRLEQLRLQAVQHRIDAELRLGAAGELVPELKVLVGAHPLTEHFHAQLMTALARGGRQADALAAYHAARERLRGDLGIEPGPELRELQRRILSGDRDTCSEGGAAVTWLASAVSRPLIGKPDPEPVVPRQLPAAEPYFCGREEELKALLGLLERREGPPGAVAITVIAGMAGIGKTTLAIRWSREVADQFPDGQLYVNLHGYDPSAEPVAPAAAIRGFLRALGVPPERIPPDQDAQAAMYRSMTAGKKILVVLDNARDAGQVRPVLPGGSSCFVVVTSRNDLTSLVAIEGADLLALDVLDEAASRELLARRLGARRSAAEPQAVTDLARLCAGLPLALSAIACRAASRPGMSLSAARAEMRDIRYRLDALDPGDPIRSVRSVFSWSYHQLSSLAAGVFLLLGAHPGPDITIPAAARLAAISPDQAGSALAELTAAHLLSEPALGRFALHDLLRAYAIEQALGGI